MRQNSVYGVQYYVALQESPGGLGMYLQRIRGDNYKTFVGGGAGFWKAMMMGYSCS